jgi:hypothetical protein
MNQVSVLTHVVTDAQRNDRTTDLAAVCAVRDLDISVFHVVTHQSKQTQTPDQYP